MSRSFFPKLLCRLSLALFCFGGPATAANDRRSAPVLGFDRFLSAATPVCRHQPAMRCVEAGFRFADADHDQRLSLEELQRVKSALQGWVLWKRDRLTNEEETAIGLGLALVDGVGLPKLMASYDADGDGVLALPELLADVRLDDRPLGEVLLDPNALDRESLTRRLGELAPLVGGHDR